MNVGLDNLPIVWDKKKPSVSVQMLIALWASLIAKICYMCMQMIREDPCCDDSMR